MKKNSVLTIALLMVSMPVLCRSHTYRSTDVYDDTESLDYGMVSIGDELHKKSKEPDPKQSAPKKKTTSSTKENKWYKQKMQRAELEIAIENRQKEIDALNNELDDLENGIKQNESSLFRKKLLSGSLATLTAGNVYHYYQWGQMGDYPSLQICSVAILSGLSLWSLNRHFQTSKDIKLQKGEIDSKRNDLRDLMALNIKDQEELHGL